MADEAPVALHLQVEPCEEDPTRYRWSVRDREQILRPCLYSLPDEQAAFIEGPTALQETAAIRRDTC